MGLNSYRSDKGDNGYLPGYERYFEPVREQAKYVLELGLFLGEPLKMQKVFFPMRRSMDWTLILKGTCLTENGFRWYRRSRPRYHIILM
jgi:hypothetical protein